MSMMAISHNVNVYDGHFALCKGISQKHYLFDKAFFSVFPKGFMQPPTTLVFSFSIVCYFCILRSTFKISLHVSSLLFFCPFGVLVTNKERQNESFWKHYKCSVIVLGGTL